MLLTELEALATTARQEINEQVEAAQDQLVQANEEEEDALHQLAQADQRIREISQDLGTLKPKELARRRKLESVLAQAEGTAKTSRTRADEAEKQREAAKVKLAALEKEKPLRGQQAEHWHKVLALSFDSAFSRAGKRSSGGGGT